GRRRARCTTGPRTAGARIPRESGAHLPRLIHLREVHAADHRGGEEDRDQDDRDRKGVEQLVHEPVGRRRVRVVHRHRGRWLRPAHGAEEGDGHDAKQGRDREDDRELAEPHSGASWPGSSMSFRRVSMMPKTMRTGTAPAYTRIWMRNTNSLRKSR